MAAHGTQLCMWDLVGGGGVGLNGTASSHLLQFAESHQKTITSLCFDGKESRVITGSLDQMVKVWDADDLKVLNSFKYSAPIMSVAVSVSF